MSRDCKCGGRLKRIDIVGKYSEQYKQIMYKDTDPLAAHWQCDRCGERKTQRKRQPK